MKKAEKREMVELTLDQVDCIESALESLEDENTMYRYYDAMEALSKLRVELTAIQRSL